MRKVSVYILHYGPTPMISPLLSKKKKTKKMSKKKVYYIKIVSKRILPALFSNDSCDTTRSRMDKQLISSQTIPHTSAASTRWKGGALRTLSNLCKGVNNTGHETNTNSLSTLACSQENQIAEHAYRDTW